MTSNSTDTYLDSAGPHIGQSLDQLRADIATLSETVARLATEGAASARSQIKDSTARVTHGATVASEQLYKNAAMLGRDAAETAHVATAQIGSQITRNPITAMLVALGLGVAIGVISRR